MSIQALCIEPQKITLLPMSGHNLPTGINGYMYAHPSLAEGLIMFEGVQTTGEGCVSAWLTNTTDFQVYVDAGEAIAFWEADMDGEFELADSLTSEVELMVNALNVKRSLSERIIDEEHASSQTRRVVGSASATQHRGDHADAVAVEVAAEATHSQQQATHMGGKVAEASCTTPSPETEAMNSAGKGVYNAEDYQWKDDHLSLDLSRIPSQHRTHLSRPLSKN